MAIKIKRGENKKGQDGAGSDKPSVLRYLEQYDDQLQKNNDKNKYLERLKASYESDPTTPQYDPELCLPRGREFQEHLGMYGPFSPLPSFCHSQTPFSFPSA